MQLSDSEARGCCWRDEAALGGEVSELGGALVLLA